MEKILIFIKHHLGFLWKIIDSFNSLLFRIMFKRKQDSVLTVVMSEAASGPYVYRKLEFKDIIPLYELIAEQPTTDLTYFKPHKFDLHSLEKQIKKSAFLMMGAFDEGKIVGYFFLRFFINKKCFVGRLIDKKYRGKGIGMVMNFIMYETSWRMGFRCLSTISRNNKAIIHAHSKNPSMVILKDLQNEYMLVEFVKTNSSQLLRDKSPV